MSRYLLLNFQDFSLNQDITQTIQLDTLLCICCLRKNVPLINITNCIHLSYLHFFSPPELEPSKKVVCYQCHNELKKIELFRRQIQESFKLLSRKIYESMDITKLTRPLTNLEIKQTVNIYLPPAKSTASKTPLKLPEPIVQESDNNEQGIIDNVETKLSIGTVKEEILSNTEIVSKSVLPDTKIKVEPEDHIEVESKECIQDRYVTEIHNPKIVKKNKVKTVTLTNEELMRERLKLAQSRSYIRFPYKCKHCIIGFNYEENIKDHMERKHGPKLGSITCEVCLQVLYPPGSLSAHLYRHFTRYDCEECGRRYNSYNDTLFHYKKRHESTDLYKCQFCECTTVDKRDSDKGVSSCKQCGVRPYTTHHRHRYKSGQYNIINTRDRNKKCSQCPRSFAHQLDLEEHLQVHDEITISDKVCDHCEESYKKLENLAQHMEVHMK